MIRHAPSPNHNTRTLPVTMLVLHYTGMQSGAEALSRLTDPQSHVSAHYLVEEDGRIFALVEEDRRAWHAGVGFWRGITDINSASIGIEIVNGGHDYGLADFPAMQINALVTLCRDIVQRHDIAAYNIVGHSDIAPGRKQDPGERFPWEKLARKGLGLWPHGPEIFSKTDRLDDDLARIGYAIHGTATHRQDIITAFQRHFMPEAMTGEPNEHTCARAHALAALIPPP